MGESKEKFVLLKTLLVFQIFGNIHKTWTSFHKIESSKHVGNLFVPTKSKYYTIIAIVSAANKNKTGCMLLWLWFNITSRTFAQRWRTEIFTLIITFILQVKDEYVLKYLAFTRRRNEEQSSTRICS